MAILNSGTQLPLKMLSNSILYCSNFKIFYFQHYYSNMHLFLVVRTYPNFSISKMLQRAIPINSKGSIYIKYLQYRQKILGILCGNVFKLQYFSINFSKFSWGGMPPDPPSSSMLRMLGSVLHTPLPKRLVP